MRLALTLACSLVACEDKQQAAPPAPETPVVVATPEPVKPIEPPIEPAKSIEPAKPKAFAIDKLAVPTAKVTVDAVLDNVRAVMRTSTPDLAIDRFVARYVHRDGTLDPSYGELEVIFALPEGVDGVVDGGAASVREDQAESVNDPLQRSR